MTGLAARGLCARDAARYCGISIARLRKYGPQPLQLCPGGPFIWDIRALDKWLDGLGGEPGTGAESLAERAMLKALEGPAAR